MSERQLLQRIAMLIQERRDLLAQGPGFSRRLRKIDKEVDDLWEQIRWLRIHQRYPDVKKDLALSLTNF